MSLWDDVIETPQNRERRAAPKRVAIVEQRHHEEVRKQRRKFKEAERRLKLKKIKARAAREEAKAERMKRARTEEANARRLAGWPHPDWDGPRAADGTPLAKPAVLSKRQAARLRKLDEIRERALQAEAADERIREAERKDRKDRKKRRVQPGVYDVRVRQVRHKKGAVVIDFDTTTLGEVSHQPRKGPYTDPPPAPVSRQSRMRRFVLERSEDLTGTSGTGIVAEGVVFSNGHVAYTWLSPLATVTTCQSIDVVERLHGHEGRARVRFLEDA